MKRSYTTTLFLLLFTLTHCKNGLAPAVSSFLPIALQGNSSDEYTEPTNTEEENTSSSAAVTLYTATDVSESCTASETPVDFGNNGPEAYFMVCNSENVDRYKHLEIRFSHPVQRASDPANPESNSLEANFSVATSSGSPLPGPAPGGKLIWKSPQRIIFDPYRELDSSQEYTIKITSTTTTTDGTALQEYNQNFTASHDYFISHSINSIALAGIDDTTFERDADQDNNPDDLVLTSSFTSSQNAFQLIQNIYLYKLGSTVSKEICSSNCSSLPSSLNLLTDTSFPPTIGGNTYYYKITTQDGKVYNRYFSFNYGDVNKTPDDLVTNVASGVLDQSHMMEFLERVIERFARNDFKVTGNTFNDFAKGDSSSTPRSGCYDFTQIKDNNNNPIAISYLKNYGNGTGSNMGGYCGDPRFTATAKMTGLQCILLGFGDCEGEAAMDVYVKNIYIQPTVSGNNPTVIADMKVNSNGELGVDLESKKAVVELAIVASFNDKMSIFAAGSQLYFETTATLNIGRTEDFRLARTKTALSVDTSGVLSLLINSGYTPDDTITDNFYIKDWTNPKDGNCWDGGSYQNGDYNYNKSGCSDNLYVDSMTKKGHKVDNGFINFLVDVVDLILPNLINDIANEMVPIVKGQITQSMLRDVVQRVAPNVLNAIVGNLKTEGVTIALPSYLPAPLGNYPLNAKIQLSTDAVLRNDGTNKGIVTSVHAGITAASAHATPRSHANASGFVYTKDPSNALIDPTQSQLFQMSASNPGFLLALHSDAVNQAAYHMWKNRVLDLELDEAFIDAINAFAGDDPLLKLSKSVLRASAIISILAPGQTTLEGIDSSGNILPPIDGGDEVYFKLDPIMPPVAKMITNANHDPNDANSGPSIEITFTDLQLSVMGRRSDSSTYKIATVRVSLDAKAKAGFQPFANKPCSQGLASCDSNKNNLNAISVTVFTEGLKYSLEALEGQEFNPYGLDPVGIQVILDPLVTSLVVPLVNSILNEIPLPASIPFPALATNNGTCLINAKTDHSIEFKGLKVPDADAANPYLFANIPLKGNAQPVYSSSTSEPSSGDAASIIQCP
ncbi:MAG: Ig-like domain-containing protein [Spirochaetota bacterium]